MSADHIKYYNSLGEEVPSCTTVLKIYNKNLDNWANYMGMKGIKLREYLEEKANFGTYVHSVTEKFFNPELTPDIHPDPKYMTPQDYFELISRLEYVKEMLHDMGYEPYKQEFVIHGERYGGTLDLLFYNPSEDKYLLIDLKTSSGLYNTMYMQLMGYYSLLEEKHNIHVSSIAILLIRRDTTDKDFLHIYDTNTDFCRHYLEIFKSLLNIYYLLDENERKKLT